MSYVDVGSEQGRAARDEGANEQWRTVPARVYVQAGVRWGVVGAMGSRFLPLAASCLLQPQVGDVVLVALGGAQAYILAVLEHSGSTAQVHLPGDTVLSTTGSLNVQAGDGLRLQSPRAVVLQGSDLALQADQCLVQARQVLMAGERCHSHFSEREEHSVRRRQSDGRQDMSVGQRVTRVSGHDDYRAVSQGLIVERDWRVRARSAELRGEQRVVIDGERLHLG